MISLRSEVPNIDNINDDTTIENTIDERDESRVRHDDGNIQILLAVGVA